MIEPLESRIAPAKLVGNVLTYFDVDGDKVTVTFSGGTPAAADLHFSVGGVDGSLLYYQALDEIVLTGKTGASVAMTATPGPTGGDGFANLGKLTAVDTDLRYVNIDGDLAAAQVGNAVNPAYGIVGLSVQSLGAFATTVDEVAVHHPYSVVIKTDVRNATLHVDGGLDFLTVGGSLRGSDLAQSGQVLVSTGNVGTVKIAHDIIAGTGSESGKFQAVGGKLTSLSIGGTVLGGLDSAAHSTAQIQVFGDLGYLRIAGDLRGRTASYGGSVIAFGKIGTAIVMGTVEGGSGHHTGYIQAGLGMGSLLIGHDLIGGSADFTGSIQSNDKTGPVTIRGTVKGGTADLSDPQIQINGHAGAMVIGGDLRGGDGMNTGTVAVGGNLTSFALAGSIIGGTASQTGLVFVGLNVGAFTVTHDLRGGDNAGSDDVSATGFISVGGSITTLAIGGSVLAGEKTGSGELVFSGGAAAGGSLGTVRIGGDLAGSGTNKALLLASGNATFFGIRSLNVIGGVSNALIASGYSDTFVTTSRDAGIGAITIGGDLIATSIVAGGDRGADGQIATLDDSFGLARTKIASLTVKGAIIGTPATGDLYVIGAGSLGPVRFGKGGTLKLTPQADTIVFSATGDYRAVDRE